MLCLYPKPTQMGLRPCRQCMNCRINLQRTWACRIQLEAQWHPYSTFVTLTYNDDHIPLTEEGLENLSPEDLKLFRRRLRSRSGYFRWFACGEYGEKTLRAHYHLIIFGISIAWQQRINEAWSDPKTMNPIGFTSLAELTPARSAYVAQYTTKKMTGHHDERLRGRWPEFARMSTNPGIGNCATRWIADQHLTRLGAKELAKQGDVFTAVRIDGKVWPLGNYMRTKVREHLGVAQTAAERAIQFNRVYHPEKEDWAQPLPEDYCPEMDVLEIPTARRFIDDDKAKRKELPEIRTKAAKAARSSRRRKSQTQNI